MPRPRKCPACGLREFVRHNIYKGKGEDGSPMHEYVDRCTYCGHIE